MKGKFFCDVCDHWFVADSDDERAECPTCREDVLEVTPDEPPEDDDHLDSMFGLDSYPHEDAVDYD